MCAILIARQFWENLNFIFNFFTLFFLSTFKLCFHTHTPTVWLVTVYFCFSFSLTIPSFISLTHSITNTTMPKAYFTTCRSYNDSFFLHFCVFLTFSAATANIFLFSYLLTLSSANKLWYFLIRNMATY
jgi:hypothetical protein